jgi:DNA polymerase elongation subunit (family B)
MVPVIRVDKPPDDGYEGATVLSAQIGAYYTPITALDFASLYPSIMMAHNLCYSTLVMSPKYDNIPGVEYEVFGNHRFAQGVPSLLPAILEELKAFRKQAKKDMALAQDPTMKKIYDGKQLAYKVSMNSVYGFTGAGKGMLPCLPIASTVTSKGRSMIEETKNYVEKHFEGAVVRYGDSVTGDTPILIRVDGVMVTKTIDSLGYKWYSDGEKEFSKLKGVESWTERGWTPVHTIIRHGTKKRIFEVVTESGYVKVTEDHSLLDPAGVMVEPKYVQPGNRLLHSFPIVTTDGDMPDVVLCASSQLTAMEMYCSFRSSGYYVKLEYDQGLFTLVPTDRPVGSKVVSVRDLGVQQGYVYDLTTENHHFQAGVGSLIVHNTDSVMVEFDCKGRTGVEAIEYSWALGERASEECSKLFKSPNDLELEKVYCPYFLYSKKRYGAKMWTKDKKGQMQMEKIDIKGLQMVRRDNTPFVREVCKEILDIMFESSDPQKAVQLAQKRGVELLDGRVAMEKLMLSQKLSDSYKSANLPHVMVRDKMREREPGSEPQSGDRVQFVIVHGDGDRQFEKSEDPGWVRANKIPLDYRYYFTNKFMNPVCDLLEPLVQDRHSVFSDLMLSKRKVGYDPKQPKIQDFFKKPKVD